MKRKISALGGDRVWKKKSTFLNRTKKCRKVQGKPGKFMDSFPEEINLLGDRFCHGRNELPPLA